MPVIMNKTDIMKTLLGIIRRPAESKDFIKYMGEMARDLDVNLHLLYAENPAYYPLGTANATGAAVARLQESLESKLEEGRKMLKESVQQMDPETAKEVAIEISAKIGNEIKLIDDLLSSGQIQMVALKHKELEGLWHKDAFAREIIRSIECPVWVIPEHSKYHSIKSIVYATDYLEEDISTLHKLVDLTHRLSPKINALHVTDNADFEMRIKHAGFQKMLETKTEYKDVSVAALVSHNGDELVRIVRSYASRNHADLIVVLKENRSFLERFFTPSSAEKIVQGADMPVLVYHAVHSN